MVDRMSHDEYVQSCRIRAAEIAGAVLSGAIPILDGCHLLDDLAGSVDVPESDPDFSVFKAIQSETDSLPIGSMRNNWDPISLVKIEAEVASATEWAKAIALPACHSIKRRFGA